MKVSIIGGAGLVGSCTAFALQTGRIVREIALVDANAEAAAGQAMRIRWTQKRNRWRAYRLHDQARKMT